MLVHHRPASETYSGIWILSLILKNDVRVGPPLTKYSGSVHALERTAADAVL